MCTNEATNWGNGLSDYIREKRKTTLDVEKQGLIHPSFLGNVVGSLSQGLLNTSKSFVIGINDTFRKKKYVKLWLCLPWDAHSGYPES